MSIRSLRRQTLAVVALVAGIFIVAPRAAQTPGPRTLTVAAASDLQAAFPELVSRIERDTGVRITISFGSSGNFFAQIQNGAPFDVFFSADIDYPRQLIKSGLADADSLYEYAVGRLVVWTRKDSGIDVSKGLAILREPRIRRI